MRRFHIPIWSVIALASLSLTAAAQTFDIPFEKTVLKNGLTVIVHEDHKAPIVSVNIWYHVGSKNEKPGKTGFAHLFEHLMFNGSEHFNDDYFQALERMGATDLNGTTNEDRTNYFQNVPTAALDSVLWLESDRMGHLLGSIDKAKLDEQRGVVQNEKRQGDNQPYSIADELITKAVFPGHHPYSHTVIGSLEDLDAASLDDVKEWFRGRYGPGNAVLVIAGDIDAKTGFQKAAKYFGEIPPGPPVANFEKWVAKRTGEQRQVAQDRVPQPRILKVWNVPGTGEADTDYLMLLSDVLNSDKGSRLYKRLVYDMKIATSVGAGMNDLEIAGLFVITASVKPDANIADAEKAINEELQKLLTDGPTQEELDRVRTRYMANFVRGAERIGGFGGKSDILARSQVYLGSPDAYKKSLARIASATTADLKAAGNRWLTDGVYSLNVVPFPAAEAVASDLDRTKMPAPGTNPPPRFPQMQRAKLANGMNIIVAERHGVPVVNFSLLLDAGYAADQFGAPGTASLAMNMLDEGTTTKNAVDISKELSSLGANLSTGSTLDASFVTLSTLKAKVDDSLKLYSEVILNPSFPQADLDRLKALQVNAIENQQSQPIQMALRVFPRLLYGPGHAYGNPFQGSGYVDSVKQITRQDILKFHSTWFKPNTATLVVVGDTTMAEIKPKLEALFAGWKQGTVPVKKLSVEGGEATKAKVFLIDKPGAAQSVILAGSLAPPRSNPDEVAIQSMNTILGGAFISRLNMNLRENKHWSYGAGSVIFNSKGDRMFFAYAPVQTDKTSESIREVATELQSIIKARPVTADEMSMSKNNLTLTLPGLWETNESVAQSIQEMVEFGLPDTYYASYPDAIAKLGLENINKAAGLIVKPGDLVWLVVGDREKIEKGIRALNLGEIVVVDADGNPKRP